MLLGNSLIFTNDEHNTILADHAVAIEGPHILEIGPQAKMKEKYREHKVLDGGGRLLMPGLINCHNHFYSTFARGLALERAPQDFHEILKLLWWKLDSALDLKSIYYSTIVPAITAIKNGTTAVIDHHASPNAIEGSLDKIEEALGLLGLRATLCYEMTDRNGREECQRGLEENARYIQKCRNARRKDPAPLFDAMVGLHASFTLDDGSLNRAAELSWATDRGCHIHVLEDKIDRTLTKDKSKHGVVERLAEHGVLAEKTIAAHGVFLTEAEMDILAATETILIHNPQSNMNNAVGRANILKLLDKKILVGLGTDGMSADIKPDARTANLLHKHDLHNPNVAWAELQLMLLKNNPKIYQRLTGQKVGRVKAGYLADLILVDYFPPTTIAPENFWAHFIFGIADSSVDTTIINGRLIMQNKHIAGLDEIGIAAHARECAEEVWRRIS